MLSFPEDLLVDLAGMMTAAAPESTASVADRTHRALKGGARTAAGVDAAICYDRRLTADDEMRQ